MAEIIIEGQIEYNKQIEIHELFESGFVGFDGINMSTDITDQFVENNTAIQDHAAIKPIILSCRGFVGEKVLIRDLAATSRLEGAIDKLRPITALLPTLSNYMQVAVAASSYVEERIKAYWRQLKDLKNIFNKNQTTSIRKQTAIVNELRMLRDNRILVTVLNDFGTFPNCLIQEANIEQSETRDQSEVVVELKQINFVSTELAQVDYKKYQDRCALQRAYEENLGKIQGIQQDTSTLRYLFDKGANAIRTFSEGINK